MNYWTQLARAQQGVSSANVATQIQAMHTWVRAVQTQRIPLHPLARLGLTDEGWLSPVPLAQLRTLDHLLRQFRQQVAYRYGMWAFVSRPLFTTWRNLYGPQRVLEVAAGNGILSAGLRAVGDEVITTDPLAWTAVNQTGRQPWVPVTPAGATAALYRFGAQVDTVVMAWAPDHEWADAHFLRVLRDDFPQLNLFVIGERNGATNSRLFWQQARFVADRRLLALNRAMPQFDAINDRIYRMR